MIAGVVVLRCRVPLRGMRCRSVPPMTMCTHEVACIWGGGACTLRLCYVASRFVCTHLPSVERVALPPFSLTVVWLVSDMKYFGCSRKGACLFCGAGSSVRVHFVCVCVWWREVVGGGGGVRSRTHVDETRPDYTRLENCSL